MFAFSEFARRMDAEAYCAPHRLNFHQIMLVTAGEADTSIDFLRHPCRPATLVHVRPGQLHRLPTADGQPAELDATIVLFTSDFPRHVALAASVVDDHFGPASWLLPPPDYAAIRSAVSEVATEYDRTDSDDDLSVEILRLMLSTLLLRIARLPGQHQTDPRSPSAEVFRRFQTELELSFSSDRHADRYAARLGYSLKTLTRACQVSTGATAKELIDARVVLESKRLLVHTDLAVATISRRLGFTEPTNFGKFFTRHTRTTPAAFRDDPNTLAPKVNGVRA